MYYGSFDNWGSNINKEPTDFIYNFINELKIISEKFINANSDVVKIVKGLQKKI